MQTYKIAIVAGDGIGPEVVASGIAIMDAAVGVAGEFAIEYVAAPVGAATYLECGSQVTGATLASGRFGCVVKPSPNGRRNSQQGIAYPTPMEMQ